jgi:phosphoenolpyruvate synthase/pyruvate phosphate dikinase
LLSVRSGAAISMPGMMDTVLNLGLTDEVADAMAEKVRDGHRSPKCTTSDKNDIILNHLCI